MNAAEQFHRDVMNREITERSFGEAICGKRLMRLFHVSERGISNDLNRGVPREQSEADLG